MTGRSSRLLATTGMANFGGASLTARLVGHFNLKLLNKNVLANCWLSIFGKNAKEQNWILKVLIKQGDY